jgi:hypothetical protein
MKLYLSAVASILCIACAVVQKQERVDASQARASSRSLQSNTRSQPLKIAVATTVSTNFHNVFYAWLSLMLYTSGLSEHEISIFAGCLDPKNEASAAPKTAVPSLMSGLECTTFSYIPGFPEKSKLHVQQHISPIPNIRRVLMLKALASTKEYDMIIYADSDAFFIRNPLPELVGLKLHREKYSVLLSSIGGDASGGFCNGFMVVTDMDLLTEWTHLGVYSQLNVNHWLRNGTVSQPADADVKRAGVTTVNRFLSPSVGTAAKPLWKVYRLPHPRYFRGVCQNYFNNTLVYHCVSYFYNAEKKKTKLGKRIFTKEQVVASKAAMTGTLKAGPAKLVEVRDFKTDAMDKKGEDGPRSVQMQVTLRPAVVVPAQMRDFRERMLSARWFNDLLRQYKVQNHREQTGSQQ